MPRWTLMTIAPTISMGAWVREGRPGDLETSPRDGANHPYPKSCRLLDCHVMSWKSVLTDEISGSQT